MDNRGVGFNRAACFINVYKINIHKIVMGHKQQLMEMRVIITALCHSDASGLKNQIGMIMSQRSLAGSLVCWNLSGTDLGQVFMSVHKRLYVATVRMPTLRVAPCAVQLLSK